MDVNLRGGAKRRQNRRSRAGGAKSRRRSRRASRRTKKMTLPKTVSVRSRKSVSRLRVSRASNSMNLTDLQFLAKDRGIPFGGLSRAKLIKKINNYMY